VKEAEEIADIADGTLGTFDGDENELRRLKTGVEIQPSGEKRPPCPGSCAYLPCFHAAPLFRSASPSACR